MTILATCTDWWASTRSPPHMFRPDYRTADVASYLRANVGVDTALLAIDLGLHASQVESFQRQLGLRKITGGGRKKKVQE